MRKNLGQMTSEVKWPLAVSSGRKFIYNDSRPTASGPERYRAFLTYVAIDKDGAPKEIPYGLEVRSVSEQARWDGALLRREYRKSRQDVGF